MQVVTISLLDFYNYFVYMYFLSENSKDGVIHSIILKIK